MGLTGCRRYWGPTAHGGSPRSRRCRVRRAGSDAPAARSRGLLSAQIRPPRIVLTRAPFPSSSLTSSAASSALGARAWRKIHRASGSPTWGCGSACLVGCTVFLADSTARRRLIASTPAAALFFFLSSAQFPFARLHPVRLRAALAKRCPLSLSLLHSGFCLLDVFTDRSERPLPCALPLEVAKQVAMPDRVWGDRVASARWGKAGRGLRAGQVWEAPACGEWLKNERAVAAVSGQPRHRGACGLFPAGLHDRPSTDSLGP